MPNREPKIAVLFPCYNAGPELAETLASIRDQTLPNHLFLVDDGSTVKPDYKTLTKSMNCTLIELPQNLGIVGAMNAGLDEILKGDFDYIARMDNGDINMLDRFERQISYLNLHSELALVGSAISAEFERTGLKYNLSYPVTPQACRQELYYGYAAWHGTLMFRISFWQAMKHYSNQYPAAEDYAMQLWAWNNGYMMGNMPDKLYSMIEMSESISGSSRNKQLKSRLKVQRENFNWLNPHAYLGVARTLALLVLPITPLRKIKRLLQK